MVKSTFDKIPELDNLDLVSRMFTIFPSGISEKALVQIFNNFTEKKPTFMKFDFKERNIQKYGQSTPPLYNFHNVKIPTYFFQGTADHVSTDVDILRLLK